MGWGYTGLLLKCSDRSTYLLIGSTIDTDTAPDFREGQAA